MNYPQRLLSSGEKVVLAFRPHWKQLIWPVFVTAVALAGVIVLLLRTERTALWIGLASTGVIWLILVIPPFLRWYFTHYVVTNERLIVRRGMLARHGKEIPLEVINDVTFKQTVWERMLRSGDLRLESAGEQGQSRFSDIPDPEGVQAIVYKLREERTRSLQGSNAPGAVEQLDMLAKLHRDGVLTDEEFEEKKQKLLGDI